VTRPAPGFFVSGTDTGVGKTLVACALVAALGRRGIDSAGMKPIETGVGAAGPLDALALQRAAGGVDPLDDVCPQRFELPAAPSVAARAEGRSVDLDAVRAAYARLRARHDCVVVEGAGGLLVPLDERRCMADLAAELDLPLLLVARGALGTINHTLLSVEAAERRGLRLAGVVVSLQAPLSRADRANLDALRQALGALLVGEVPPLASGQPLPAEALPEASALRAEGLLDVDALLARAAR
jgi:dethiobiotin synthetase